MSVTSGLVGEGSAHGPESSSSGGTRVYVASPLGFAASTRFYYLNELLPRVEAAGHTALDPWKDEDGALALALGAGRDHGDPLVRREELAKVDAALGARNVALIQEADALLAVLDGTDVDSGTAAEGGYAYGLGKPVVGLRTDFRDSGENEGCTVNLQVEYFVRASGGTIVADLADALAALDQVVTGKVVSRRAH